MTTNIFQAKKTQTSSEISSQEMMLQTIWGGLISQSVYVAAKLGIADLLKDGQKSCSELAALTGTDVRSLYRLMRALSSIGIFTENEQDHFMLTPLATCLQRNIPGSLHALIVFFNQEKYNRVYANLLYSVQTGHNAFEYIYGMNMFQYLTENPKCATIFNEGMACGVEAEKTAIIEAYDFSGILKLIDVGGGKGNLISAILKSNPKMEGVLYEQPGLFESTKDLLEKEGVSERCQFVAGDFFESVPAGGEVYILKHILHDWDDERAITILKNCHEEMPENGRILVVEIVIQPGNEQFEGKFADLFMLLFLKGAERTKKEYRVLFERAGFKLKKIIPTQGTASIIEGIRV